MTIKSISKNNMLYGIIHGAFFNMGIAFADPYAVIPLFLAGFIDSKMLIGLIVSLTQVVSIIPSVPISRYVRRRPETAKTFMLIGIWLRCAVWGIIAITTLCLPHNSIWVPIAFISLIGIFSFGGGIANIPFKQVITTIPPEQRSSFFGWRMTTGGILAIGAGLIVKFILGSEILQWPKNYGFLFLLSFLILIIAYSAMSKLQFIIPQISDNKIPSESFFKESIQTIKKYPVFIKLTIIRLFAGGTALILPFLTIYTTDHLNISLGWIGIYIAVQKIGSIGSNFLWMPLGNKLGTRIVIITGLLLSIISILLLIYADNEYLIAGVFFLLGMANSATLIGFNGYILELGTKNIQPLLFALEAIMIFPVYFMPLLGGWIADNFNYHTLFILGTCMLTGAVLLAVNLCEPRKDDIRCGPRKP